MKKRGKFILVFLVLIIISSFTFAEEDKLDNARTCIKDQLANDCSKVSQDQWPFIVLALGNYGNCVDLFLNNSREINPNQECWPKSSCDLKETAIALMTLKELNRNTEKVENWLLNQTKTASDLDWILQIESPLATSCSIKYGSLDYSIQIGEDKKISADAGSCLTRTSGNYWFQIKSDDTCLSNEYEVLCNETFTTTLLYKTRNAPTIYVSTRINSGSADQSTTEKVSYLCFKKGIDCNYEGSLWAAFVLNKFSNKDMREFLPYLESGVNSNLNLFPETFLYTLTSDQRYQSIVLSDKFNNNFWSVGNDRFYSSSVAFMSFSNSPQADLARTYFLNNQGQNGCWGTIKQTAFLLFSGWDSFWSISPPPTPPGSTEKPDCINNGNFCLSSAFECTSETRAGGQVLDNYRCPISQVCCSKKYERPSCSSLGGIICPSGERCKVGSGFPESSEQGCCIIGDCEPISITPDPTPIEPTCGVINDGDCKSECANGEEVVSGTCAFSGDVCCEKKSGSMWWVWILLILIIIVVVLIIFRNQLRLFIFKTKSNFKKGPLPPSRIPPRLPPRPPQNPPMNRPRQFAPNQRPQNNFPPRPPVSKDKDFEDTLKKLKEMGN